MDLRKYGVATHLYKPIIKRSAVDFAVSADWTPAAGDVKISKDGGAAASVTNLPTAITMGNTAMWDYSLTATEMQAAQIKMTVADAATKAVEDQFFEIETYGHASAQHVWDLSSATPTVNATQFAGQTITAAAGVTLPTSVASPTNITAGTITTVTTLTNAPSDSAGVTTLLARLTALRAGYLDNLSAGAVALEASLQGLITTVGASAAGLATAVWSAVTRTLSAGTNIVLAKGTGVTGFTDLDAGAVRTAVGLGSANLDTQLDALPTNAELATALATADDATLAAIAAILFPSLASIAAQITSDHGSGSYVRNTEPPTTAENADKLIGRNIAGGSDGGRTVKDVLRFNRNKILFVPINATSGTFDVYDETDGTIAWSGTYTRAAADALAGMDPT